MITRFFPADAEGGAEAGRLTFWTGGACTGAGAGAGGGGAGAGTATAAAGAGALAGSIITPMTLSDTPAVFSFTRSAGASFIGLFALCKLLMIRDSGKPAFTDAITSSTGDAAAAGFAAAGFAAAGFAGAGAGAGAWAYSPSTSRPGRVVKSKLRLIDLSSYK